jgi:hypothetical protein
MTTHEKRLVNDLLDALCLQWHDNGNISADAIRDECLQTLSYLLGKSVPEIVNMIDRKVQSLQ